MWNPEKVEIIKKAIDPNHSKRSRRLRGRDV